MDWSASITLWFSVGRDIHRSAKGGYPEITISSFDVFYKNRFYLEGVWLWRISGGGQSHNWMCDWPFD